MFLLSLKIVFILANSADPDDSSESSLFVKEPIEGFPVCRGLNQSLHLNLVIKDLNTQGPVQLYNMPSVINY